MDHRSNKENRQAELLRLRPELIKDSMMAGAFSDHVKRAREEMEEICSSRERLVALMEILQKEDWRQMRAYLTVLKEYLPLMDVRNQDIILDFLADMLAHKSGMVRRIAARTYGHLLACRQKEYGIAPDDEIRRVLFPGISVSAAERRKINYQLKYILLGFRESADETLRKQLLNHYAGYFKSSRWDSATCFYLIMGIVDIPCDEWSNLQKYHIFSFLRNNLDRDNEEVRLAALHLLEVWLNQGWKISDEIKDYLNEIESGEEARYCECHLIARIHDLANALPAGEAEVKLPGRQDIMLLFQENQHSHALWINKILNLAILKDLFFKLRRTGEEDHPYYDLYAGHLISMLRLNKQAVVFLQAGSDLAEVIPYLQSYQKFEIMKDILQSLENVDDYYNFTAPFAGRAFLSLEPSDQMELIPRLWELADRQEPSVVNTTLEVVAEILKNYFSFMEDHLTSTPEAEDLLKGINKNLCSIMSTGMASYKPGIAREAFFLTGQTIFAHVGMEAPFPAAMLLRLARKALISLNRKNAYADDFYNYSAVRYIYRNLENHSSVICGSEQPPRIAFFSGSFDPFSRGHKAIAREVAEMGYRVYLDAHDFSWYKKLQPKEIRRQIIYLSISDLENVILFPDDYPVSLENPEDLTFLRSLFPDSEVTLVVSSDTVEGCEAYWKEPEEGSVHGFPHIIFQRGTGISRSLIDSLISGETQFLQVPSYFDHMTSEEIQKQIALGRDISDMVDHQVKNYVFDKKLYRSEPIYKKIAKTRAVDFIMEDQLPEEGLPAGSRIPFTKSEVSPVQDPEGSRGRDQWLFMEEKQDGKSRIVSAVTWHEISACDLYDDLRNLEQTQDFREYVSGRLLVITGLYGAEASDDITDACMIVCNELLALCQKKELSYAVCLHPDSFVRNMLKRFGFIEAIEDCMYTDLRHPLTMFYDADSFIKEPYCQHESVSKVIEEGKRRIQEILPDLYPGNLILHFDAPVINYRMIRLITQANHVDGYQTVPVEEDGTPLSYESFGEKMCVPFGKLLKGVLIPNTVTKELYVEKLYESDLHTFDIQEFPDYETLRTQIRTIRAFKRPAIFVDDLYHKGYRMNKIQKLLKDEKVPVDCFMVGVLSGQGKDRAKENHLEVEAPYFIPDMRAWIVESDLYPFIGGDGINSDEEKQENLTGLPSTNLILPYQIPKFLEGSSLTDIYRLSETSMINARELFRALEKIYQKKNYHSLTFGRIGEVMSEPRYPEGMVSLKNNEELVSDLLSEELAKLRRLRFITLFDRKS